jgi:hypothetical protein
MKMEQTGCSKMSAYKIQTPGNYPEESIQHSEHGKSLKSRIKAGSLKKKQECGKVSKFYEIQCTERKQD